MIGFLKNYFVTKGDFDNRVACIYRNLENKALTDTGLQHQFDQLAAELIELRKKVLLSKEDYEPITIKLSPELKKDIDRWRPEAKHVGSRSEEALNTESARTEVRKAKAANVVRVSNSSAVTLPSSLPRHIAEARIMIGKAGGLAKLKQCINSGRMHIVLSGSLNINEQVYLGRLTIYDKGERTRTQIKRHAMTFKTDKQVREVMSYLRSSGITFKDNRE